MIKTGKYDILYQVDPESALDDHIVKHGIFDDYLLHSVDEYVSTDGIFVDVGANAGYYSLVFAKKGMKCFAFEPIPEIFEKLTKNVFMNCLDIECFEEAVQDHDDVEYVEMYKRDCIDSDGLFNDGLSSLLDIGLFKKGKLRVKATTIDKKCEGYKVSLIKIDAEGFDYNVLLGGLETINKYKPVILYEHSSVMDEIAKNDCAINCYNLMKSLGYKQYFTDCLPVYEIKEFEYRKYANVLCVGDK